MPAMVPNPQSVPAITFSRRRRGHEQHPTASSCD
jgi:hypothetical protein